MLKNRYLTSLDRETKAFKRLVEEKARMTVSIVNTSVSDSSYRLLSNTSRGRFRVAVGHSSVPLRFQRSEGKVLLGVLIRCLP